MHGISAPVIEDIRTGGRTSLGAIADGLNAWGTRRGGRWHKSTVINLLGRLGEWCFEAAS